MVSDDGNIVSSCRVMIPEQKKLYELQKEENKKPEEKFDQNVNDNGVQVHIEKFNLDKDFKNIKTTSNS